MSRRLDPLLCGPMLHPWIDGAPFCNECKKTARRESARRNVATARAWDRANRDKVNLHAKRYRQANPDKVLVAVGRRRSRLLKCEGTHTPAEWKAVKRHYGNACVICKVHSTDATPMTKDHIMPLAAGGTDFAFNLQPLCRPCNSTKSDSVAIHVPPSLFDCKERTPLPITCDNDTHPKTEPGACRTCSKARQARWIETNPELHLAVKRAWNERNKERVTATTRAWQAAHPDRSVAASRRYREAHPEAGAIHQAKRRIEMAAQARCACGSPAKEARKTCQRCLDTHTTWAANNREKKRATARKSAAKARALDPEKHREAVRRNRAKNAAT